MKCRETLDLLAGYRNKTLRAPLMNGVREHLGSCEKCRMEFEAYERTVSAIVSGIGEIEPSPDYMERFAAKVATGAAQKQRGKSLESSQIIGKFGDLLDSIFGALSPQPVRFAFAAALFLFLGLSALFVSKLNEKEGEDEELFETIVVAQVALNADMLEELELMENLEGLENMELVENLEEYLN